MAHVETLRTVFVLDLENLLAEIGEISTYRIHLRARITEQYMHEGRGRDSVLDTDNKELNTCSLLNTSSSASTAPIGQRVGTCLRDEQIWNKRCHRDECRLVVQACNRTAERSSCERGALPQSSPAPYHPSQTNDMPQFSPDILCRFTIAEMCGSVAHLWD